MLLKTKQRNKTLNQASKQTKTAKGGKEMAQQLGSLTAFAEDQSSILSSHVLGRSQIPVITSQAPDSSVLHEYSENLRQQKHM